MENDVNNDIIGSIELTAGMTEEELLGKFRAMFEPEEEAQAETETEEKVEDDDVEAEPDDETEPAAEPAEDEEEEEPTDPMSKRTAQFKIKRMKVERKEAGSLTEGIIEGYASVFGNVDAYGDVVTKGAFKQTITHNGGKFRFMLDHGYGFKDLAGVAEVIEDDKGLKFIGHLNLEKQSMREAFSDVEFSLQKGLPLGVSIGYSPVTGKTTWIEETRFLNEVKLFEVSLTPFPANTAATVENMKALKNMREEIKQELLRELSAADAPNGNQEQNEVEGADVALLAFEQYFKSNLLGA